MIQGTRSHELNQLQIFKSYETDLSLNFKIIETVQTENVLGAEILYIPEEYPEDSDAYYKEYKTKKYNICFSHGTWDFIAPPGTIEISQRSTHSAPVLFWKDWEESLENGFVSSGHIHGRNVYKNKIFYPGSFSRWSYGERSEKGFTYFEYDLEESKYKVEFVNNTMAPKYDVVSISNLDLSDEEKTADNIQRSIDEFLESTDNLRVDISGVSEEIGMLIKEYYRNNKKVKLEFKDEKKALLKESLATKQKEFEKWHYITKRTLPLNETIKKYCKEEFNKDISIDLINSVINNKEV